LSQKTDEPKTDPVINVGIIDPIDILDSPLAASNEAGDLVEGARYNTPASIPDGGAESEMPDEDDLDEEAEMSYEDGLEEGLNLNPNLLRSDQDSVIEKQEYTRSRLATIYLISTFLIFVLGMALAVIDGIIREVSIVENLKEVLSTISGIFLGTLGFVLGYYFRKGDE
jgi:hypothetical protein